jgi:hypothetical protein
MITARATYFLYMPATTSQSWWLDEAVQFKFVKAVISCNVIVVD